MLLSSTRPTSPCVSSASSTARTLRLEITCVVSKMKLRPPERMVAVKLPKPAFQSIPRSKALRRVISWIRTCTLT